MLSHVKLAAMGCAFVLAATLPLIAASARSSSVERGDLVVIGRIKNQKYEALDEFGLSGRITARLMITKVLKGRAPASVIPIYYIAHADWSEGRQFRLRLRSTKDNIWLVCREGGGPGYICR